MEDAAEIVDDVGADGHEVDVAVGLVGEVEGVTAEGVVPVHGGFKVGGEDGAVAGDPVVFARFGEDGADPPVDVELGELFVEDFHEAHIEEGLGEEAVCACFLFGKGVVDFLLDAVAVGVDGGVEFEVGGGLFDEADEVNGRGAIIPPLLGGWRITGDDEQFCEVVFVNEAEQGKGLRAGEVDGANVGDGVGEVVLGGNAPFPTADVKAEQVGNVDGVEGGEVGVQLC